MPRIFGRFFGTGAKLAQARAAELRGDLAHAAVLFAQAGRPDESARIMALRGDAEVDPAARLRHYVQAAATAPPGSAVHTLVLRKRAATLLAMVSDSPLTAALRRDLSQAARDLEAASEHALAADAYARAGDIEGQVAALARAGEIDRLDAVLAEQHDRDRDRLARRGEHDRVTDLAAAGRRRDAVQIARASEDEALRDQGQAIEQRRVAGTAVRVRLRGVSLGIALGEEVIVGRAQATIDVASPAVSRRQVAIARHGDEVIVRDLGSRNGTLLRGLALRGEAPVGDGLELRLGGEVPMIVRPATELAGAMSIDVAGQRWLAPLGPAQLGVGRWRLERGTDDWIELVTDDSPPAYEKTMRLAGRVTLLAGDAIATERSAEPVLEIRPREP